MGLLEAFRRYTEVCDTKPWRKYDEPTVKKVAQSFCLELTENRFPVEDAADLEEYLRTSRSKKERKKEMLLRFYRYCKAKEGLSIESDLENKIVIDDPMQRRIAMIMFLQNKKKTTEEIADIFMIDGRTARGDLQALEDGIKFFGGELKIEMEHEGWNRYMAKSRHPVMLELNMPEVVAMTVGLWKNAETDPVFGPQYRKIARDVYAGLTAYAKGRIMNLAQQEGLDLEDTCTELQQYERELSSKLITMMKAGCPGKLHIYQNDKEIEIPVKRIKNYRTGMLIVSSENGEQAEIRMENICECQYELERVFSD